MGRTRKNEAAQPSAPEKRSASPETASEDTPQPCAASSAIQGLHHLTALARDPQRTLDFYTQTLGMRLVKWTVNPDAPDSYQLYFGDAEARPGTLLSCLIDPDAPQGRAGTGQVAACGLTIPPGAALFWLHRLADHEIDFAVGTRFGDLVIAFCDPDGLPLELIASETDSREAAPRSDLSSETRIQRIHSISLRVEGFQRTASLLTNRFGLKRIAEENERVRFAKGKGEETVVVDVLCQPLQLAGVAGAGAFHHAAWRVRDVEAVAAWQSRLARSTLNTTPVRDHTYFQALFFREPGGVLFGIASDTPGFMRDESPDALGSALRLPALLEEVRDRIVRNAPPLRLPEAEDREAVALARLFREPRYLSDDQLYARSWLKKAKTV
jgi:glyoxalase family protein